MDKIDQKIDLSIVMPCLNEKKTIGVCINKAKEYLSQNSILGEVIVSDNGSTDESKEIASSFGAKVVKQPKKGYGNAYHKGISEAKGKIIVIGDSDNTYDFSKLDDFVKPLMNGYEMVIGNRFAYKIDKEAMPWLHRYIGNPILSGILRFLFKLKIRDAHCGLRSFTRNAYNKLGLHTAGMEYASEMIVAASEAKLKITEAPIRYHIREGESKLNSFSDGWRHLRFMLLYSPNYLFLSPAIVLGFIGITIIGALYNGPIYFYGRMFDFHPLFLGIFLVFLAFQFLNLGIFTKVYSYQLSFKKNDALALWFLKKFTLEKGIIFGSLITFAGLTLLSYIFYNWIKVDFGPLFELRRSLLSLLFLSIGIQIIFSSFFLSMIMIKKKKEG